MTDSPTPPEPPEPRPIFAYVIIGLCVAVFLYQWQDLESCYLWGALWPLGERFHVWQLVTYAFLHGGLSHLIFNLLGIHMFGGALEQVLGTRRVAMLYFISVLTAAAAQLAVQAQSGAIYPTVGASGGLFGLLLMFALLFPQRKLLVFPLPIPLPAWLFVTLYAGVELYLGVTGTLQGIAHFAHLGGLVGGLITWLLWRRSSAR